MALGKYFYIKSRLNDMVLDVRGGETEPGTPVITWPQKPEEESDNQLWYEDPIVGAIRTKLNNLCLDLNDDGEVVIQEFEDGRGSQQWITSGDRVQNRGNPQRVLDIKAARAEEGTSVIAWDSHDGDNQKWTFQYISPKYFYVVTKLNGKVLDAKHPEHGPGAKVVVKERNPDGSDSQLWYEDRFGVLCNKRDNLVPDSSDEKKIRLMVDEPGNTDQLWTVQEDRIINRAVPHLVLDIKGKKHKEGAKVISYGWNGGENQRWRFEYV